VSFLKSFKQFTIICSFKEAQELISLELQDSSSPSAIKQMFALSSSLDELDEDTSFSSQAM